MEEAEKKSGVVSWIQEHLWLLTMIAGVLVFFALCGPFVHAKPVAFDGWTDDGALFHKTSSDRADIWIGGMMSPLVWPLIVEFVLVIAGIVLAGFGKKYKYSSFGAMMSFIVAGILFLMNVSFYDFCVSASYVDRSLSGDALDVLDYYMPNFSSASGTKIAFGSVYGGVFSFIAAFMAFGEASNKETYSVRDLTEIGILVAAAIGLHYVKIPVGADGGSINLAPIPLFIIALRHGAIKGFFASGIIYGLIACVLSGWGLITYPLDYLVGWGSFAVLGLFRKLIFTDTEKVWSPMGFVYIFIGVLLSTVVRYIGSGASSMINYGYSFKAAIVYNVIYVPVTGAVALVAMEALYIPLAKLEKHFPVAQ